MSTSIATTAVSIVAAFIVIVTPLIALWAFGYAVVKMRRHRSASRHAPELAAARRMGPGARTLGISLTAANGALALSLVALTPDLLAAATAAGPANALTAAFAAAAASAVKQLLQGIWFGLGAVALAVLLQLGTDEDLMGPVETDKSARLGRIAHMIAVAFALVMSFAALTSAGATLFAAYDGLEEALRAAR